MKFNGDPLGLVVFLMMTTVVGGAQTEPTLERATPAVLEAFQTHDIVMLGEMHGKTFAEASAYTLYPPGNCKISAKSIFSHLPDGTYLTKTLTVTKVK